jgi:hypothetical protein
MKEKLSISEFSKDVSLPTGGLTENPMLLGLAMPKKGLLTGVVSNE